jgi:hypothetical protein
MSETTIRDLFHSLEVTLHERLRTIEDVIRAGGSGRATTAPLAGVNDYQTRMLDAHERRLDTHERRFDFCQLRVDTTHDKEEVQKLRKEVAELRAEIAALRRSCSAGPELIPHAPLEGIEVVPKREVVIPDVVPAKVLSIENRLLLNTSARKALEAQEMGVRSLDDITVFRDTREEVEVVEGDAEEGDDGEEVEVVEEEEEEVEEEEVEEEEVEEEVVEEEEEEVEEEVVEEEAEEEAEEEGLEETDVEEEEEEEVVEEEAEEDAEAEVELEEFEYKGSTYYRDGEGNVYMADEDGELMEEPIGMWNEAKQRIIVKKA